jgi:phenylacetate-CoA ligase
MMLLDSEREVIESVLGVPVSNRYGCEEVGLIAAECEVHEGLHINAEHVVVEFVDHAGNPANPGEEASLILTDLNNYAMPLVRYEVGDMASYDNIACPCGRSYPLLRNLLGRTADYLLRSDGSRLSGISMVEKTLTAIDGLQQLQIIQLSVSEFELNAVIENDREASVRSQLERAIQDVFGGHVSVSVRQVPRLKRESNGKYRFAIRRF